MKKTTKEKLFITAVVIAIAVSAICVITDVVSGFQNSNISITEAIGLDDFTDKIKDIAGSAGKAASEIADKVPDSIQKDITDKFKEGAN